MPQSPQPVNHTSITPPTQAQQPHTPLPYGPPLQHEPELARTYHMVTRSQLGIIKPIVHLSLHTLLISPLPKSLFLALNDHNWCNAMYDEYNALNKFHADGSLSRYKARLVANGSSQQLGVDFDETFSLVVKSATIRKVLSLAVSRQWHIHQLDVKNAFLNNDLSKTVYMHQPLGFVDSRYPRHGSQVAYLLIYVGDFILTASSPALLQQIIDSLHKEFDMTDLEALNYFLGISAALHCNPSWTPVDTESKLGPDGVSVQNLTLYRSFAGGLQELHFAALKRILRYVKDTLDFGLHLYASATTSLVGYTDADWAGCPSTRSAEAEYRSVSNVVAKTAWVRNLVRELHSPLLTATLVYYDNVSAVYMSVNPVQHQRTKHIEIYIHFVRGKVTTGHVHVLHVPSYFRYAYIFTKGLPSDLFEDLRSSLSVCPPPAQIEGAY
ncbi:ribonuclease H-like domain-containing protein [Tanacetum coccineum]